MEKRCSFELFKSNVCHWLKEEGDIDFLIQVLESDLILHNRSEVHPAFAFCRNGSFDFLCESIRCQAVGLDALFLSAFADH